MLLAKGESVVKEWEYAPYGKTNSHAKLILTNRRLVHYAENELVSTQDEIPVNKIKGISCSHRKTPKTGKRGWLVGLILAICGAIVLYLDNDRVALGSTLIGLGVVLAVLAILGSRQASSTFVLVISTMGPEGEPFVVGPALTLTGKRVPRESVDVAVSEEVADEIINSIGAYIAYLQHNGRENATATE